jgi:AcrR family transcriptional regulator
MGRLPPGERLAAVASTATAVFGRSGYRGTRMADVAAEAGMSSGAIFTYVESKEALFQLVFAFGFGCYQDTLPDLPLPTPADGETVALIADHLKRVPTPALRAALAEDNPADVRRELAGIVAERYSAIATLWPLLAVIERCAVDLPELEDFYFRRMRTRYFDQLAKYLAARQSTGRLRAMPDTAVTARLITEAISWFAWKRHEGRDALLYDEDVAKQTVVAFIGAALVAEE